jgi:outer membrane protein TolC
MGKTTTRLSLFTLVACLLMTACNLPNKNESLQGLSAPATPQLPNTGVKYLDVQNILDDNLPEDLSDLSPNQISDYRNLRYEEVGLDQCIALALSNSEVARDLGVNIIRSPNGMVTQYDPALTYSNPRFGEEAALSEFDAQVASSLFFQKNDRPFNNLITGNSNGLFQQDLLNYQLELSKRAATGTLMSLRNRIEYDANNQATNRYPHTWQSILEGEFRQPLLQGSGAYFNRIAGPSQQPGVYNGVLIARANTEISLVRFEQSIYNLVSNVENAYWDLYFAYQELDAQVEARNQAYELWQAKKKEQGTGDELQYNAAYEQYLRFENSIINSMEGRPVDGTRTDNGTAGGTARGNPGVRYAERRLRYLLGMSITDGTLLRPATEPERAGVAYEWNTSLESALLTRPEIRQQRWVVAQKQLELVAAKNFLLPRLDIVGNYRFRGMGKDLTGGSNTFQDDINAGATYATAQSNAFGDLFGGDFQEWQLGAELRSPVGFRRAHAAVRSAELSINRERAVLKEQERSIRLGLSNAIGEVKRSQTAMELAKDRYQAATKYRDAAVERNKSGRASFDVLLEAERRMLEARLQFIQAEVDHTIAIRNVHYEKGTLLDYRNVYLTEAESSYASLRDYQRRSSYLRRPLNYVVRDPAWNTAEDNAAATLAGQEMAPVFNLQDPNQFIVPQPSGDNLVPTGPAPVEPPMQNQSNSSSSGNLNFSDTSNQSRPQEASATRRPPTLTEKMRQPYFSELVDPAQFEVLPSAAPTSRANLSDNN